MPCHQSLSENSEPPKLSCLIIGGSIATAKLAAMLWKSHISIWGFPDIGVPHTYIIYIYICMCICFCICIYPKDLPYTYDKIFSSWASDFPTNPCVTNTSNFREGRIMIFALLDWFCDGLWKLTGSLDRARLVYIVPLLGAFKSQLGGTYNISLLLYTVNVYCDLLYIYIYIYICTHHISFIVCVFARRLHSSYQIHSDVSIQVCYSCRIPSRWHEPF